MYERFEQLIFNSAFPVGEVVSWLNAAGFAGIQIRAVHDFSQQLADPEEAERVAVIARK